MNSRTLLTAVFLICVGLIVGTLKSQTSSTDHQVKATFLYNFAQFVEWPGPAFSDTEMPFTMCILGDAVRDALETTVGSEKLKGRRVNVRRLDGGERLRGCHIVYIGGTDGRRVPEMLAEVAGTPVLTVGDWPDFINAGGMIRFTESGNRIRFEVNPEAAERASLRVSSRLLRLADIARPRKRTLR